MQNVLKSISLLITFSIMGGCSLVPYEENFACDATDNYGRCVGVDGAYRQALGGEPEGYKIKKEDDPDAEPASDDDMEIGGSLKKSIEGNETTRYRSYRENVYTKLKRMVSNPKTPMVKTPEVVRTLVLNYKAGGEGNPLFMHRFIYFFGDEPSWVLDQRSRTREEYVLPVLGGR